MYRLSKIRTSARTSSPREDNDHFPSARWASSSEEPELLQAQRPFSSYVRMDIVLEQIQVLWFESNREKMEMSRETKHRPALQNWIRFENRKKKRNGKVGKSGMGRRKNLENRFARIVFRSSPDSNLCAIISFFERGKKVSVLCIWRNEGKFVHKFEDFLLQRKANFHRFFLPLQFFKRFLSSIALPQS